VHFTAEDLARTRLLTEPDPLWEVILSNFRLSDNLRPVFLESWRASLYADKARMATVRPAARLLATLAPQGPYFPDFLTPAEASAGLDAGLAAVASTPRRRLCAELNLLAEINRRRGRPVPYWLGAFAAGDRFTLTRLTTVLRNYYETAIAPQRGLIRAVVDADIRGRTEALRAGGVEGLFRSFVPLMAWKAPVLEICYDVDQDLVLQGRGLRLIPSFFCHRSAISVADPNLVPVIIYPIPLAHRWLVGQVPNRQAMKKLMGTTRSAVLFAVDEGATTTQLAGALSTSLSAVSRHTAVLRESGLLITRRRGPAVWHTLTDLGQQFLGSVDER
jgi:DNA-binding transcriptional ArsR family regulator